MLGFSNPWFGYGRFLHYVLMLPLLFDDVKNLLLCLFSPGLLLHALW